MQLKFTQTKCYHICIGGAFVNEISLQELLDRILCAEAHEFSGILDAVTERYAEVFPSRELLTLSAPGSDPEKQTELLQSAIHVPSGLKK